MLEWKVVFIHYASQKICLQSCQVYMQVLSEKDLRSIEASINHCQMFVSIILFFFKSVTSMLVD